MLLVKMEKPLYPVAKEGNHKVVELLLSREDIEVNPMGMDGDTPLNNAAYEGYHMVVVEILLKRGEVFVNKAVWIVILRFTLQPRRGMKKW